MYTTIYHQLADVTVSASLSLSPVVLTPIGDAAAILRGNVTTILNWTPPTSGPIVPVRLDALSFVLPSDNTQYHADLLQSLAASLSLLRGRPVDPSLDAASAAPVRTSTTTLPPDCATVLAPTTGTALAAPAPTGTAPVAPPPPSVQFTLQGFAKSFEATFVSMQMRVVTGDADEPHAIDLWVLRWGKGALEVSLGAEVDGFAPPPFATSLQSRTGIAPLVNAAMPGNPFQIQQTALAVTNFDVDAALGDALAAIENFLAPQYGIPAAVLDATNATDYVDQCLAAKQQIAAQLGRRAAYLGTGASTAWLTTAQHAAQSKYEQLCLIDLTNYYSVDAIAVLQVAAGAPTGLSLPTLAIYGHPTDTNPTDVSVCRAASARSAAIPLRWRSRCRRGTRDREPVMQFCAAFQIAALERVTGSSGRREG